MPLRAEVMMQVDRGPALWMPQHHGMPASYHRTGPIAQGGCDANGPLDLLRLDQQIQVAEHYSTAVWNLLVQQKRAAF